jgi:L-lactate dehydrogenase complex protein LldF
MVTFLGLPGAPRGIGQLRGDRPFPEAAEKALADGQLRRNLGNATATIRAKRAAVVGELPDRAELRVAAGVAIKDRVSAVRAHREGVWSLVSTWSIWFSLARGLLAVV